MPETSTKIKEQITSHILMVRPANFGFNKQTAENNTFQVDDGSLSAERIKELAIAEFDTFVQTLREAGVTVVVAQDSEKPVKNDAVFPNNWVTFHDDATVITYPMHAPMRRQERREDILTQIAEDYQVGKRVHLEDGEDRNQFLEGTGSMIFDRQHQIVYACRSVRTDEHLLDRFCKQVGAEKLLFDAVDTNGIPIYHTNVMMALGETFVVICLDTIAREEEKAQLLAQFNKTNKEVIEISLDQMMAFAGNMLQVKNRAGERLLVMSSQAYNSLTAAQIEIIGKHTGILHSNIKIIETYGGGSARCMMAEIFLPLKK